MRDRVLPTRNFQAYQFTVGAGINEARPNRVQAACRETPLETRKDFLPIPSGQVAWRRRRS